jgi:hypothetical protein
MNLIKSDVRLFVRFRILKAVSVKGTIFGDVMPFTVLKVDRRFRGTYFLDLQEYIKPSK